MKSKAEIAAICKLREELDELLKEHHREYAVIVEELLAVSHLSNLSLNLPTYKKPECRQMLKACKVLLKNLHETHYGIRFPSKQWMEGLEKLQSDLEGYTARPVRRKKGPRKGKKDRIEEAVAILHRYGLSTSSTKIETTGSLVLKALFPELSIESRMNYLKKFRPEKKTRKKVK